MDTLKYELTGLVAEVSRDLQPHALLRSLLQL